MVEPKGFLPSNSSWLTQEAPLNPPILQQTPQQQSHKFQALRDWNWFQSALTSPWDLNPVCPVSSYGGPGYVHHHSGRFHAVARTGAGMSTVHVANGADSHVIALHFFISHQTKTPSTVSQYRIESTVGAIRV